MKIVKIKYSGGSLGKNLGCEEAPDLISETGQEVLVDNSNVDETMKNLSEARGDVFIGGDHSITYGSFKGFAKKFTNQGLVIFDAHPDLEVSSGSVSHEDYLRKLIEEGVIRKENVILVGVRKVSKNEQEFMKGMHFFKMEQIFNNEENVCDAIMETALSFSELYLSIDIDVLDPAFAPGTGHLEPGGLSVQQLFYFLRRMRNLRNLRRIDLVEINPDKDVNGVTVKIGKDLLGLFV